MKRYESSIPRVACGIAAATMTAIALGVSVVLPAKMGSYSPDPSMLEASKVTRPAAIDIVAVSASRDLVVVHESGLSAVPCTSSQRNSKPEG